MEADLTPRDWRPRDTFSWVLESESRDVVVERSPIWVRLRAVGNACFGDVEVVGRQERGAEMANSEWCAYQSSGFWLREVLIG